MLAVEKNDLQSKKTDASLYKGRPTDTGAQCHNVGAAARTPSIPKDKDGVSVENVLTPNKQWFLLRVSYGRALKAKEIIDTCYIDCFAPMRHKQITKHGKKHIITELLIPSFIFVHTSQEEVDAMLHEKNVNSIESHPLLSYYYNHTSYRQDNLERNPPLIIRDEAMDNFIKLTCVKKPYVFPVTSHNIQYKLGNHVIVTEGDFEGIQGRVARTAGQQRVIVELFSGCLVATAYILKEEMKHIIPSTTNKRQRNYDG